MQQDLQAHQRRARRIETLLQDVASFPDEQMRAVTEELVQTLLDLYSDGLARMLELITAYAPEGTSSSTASGPALIESLAHDEVVSSLLVLHGLHPLDLKTRVTRVLHELQPYLKSQGGRLELISLENHTATLRFTGGGHGCASSGSALKARIEETLYHAVPDLEGILIEETSAQPPARGVPVTFIAPRKHHQNRESRHARSEL